MENYKINSNTLAIIPIEKSKSKIYENDNVIIVNKSTKNIISENCEYYGSTFEGRKHWTVDLIGVTHKCPILIEDTSNIIFFPTCSPRLSECGWICLNNLDVYNPYDKNSVVRFKNNLTLKLDISEKILNNQVLRATRLESILMKRKYEILSKNSTEKKSKFN